MEILDPKIYHMISTLMFAWLDDYHDSTFKYNQ